MRSVLVASAMAVVLAISPHLASLPHPAERNVRGIHTLVHSSPEEIARHLDWALMISGPGGHVTQPFSPVDWDTTGPSPEAVTFVHQAYARGLNPIIRLQGPYSNQTGCDPSPQGGWPKPIPDLTESDPPTYRHEADGYMRFVSGLPRADGRTLYIQVANEPNLHFMWGGQANPEEYARFFVDVAAAIRSLGDPRIKILNAGLAPEGDVDNLAFIREAISAEPLFAASFDYWASHSYPHNQPPENNLHDATALPNSRYTIDAYLLELETLRSSGVDTIEVILTETGYQLGDNWYHHYPSITEDNRADYIKRAFEQFWSNWPEVHAVTPFQLSDGHGSWKGLDWIRPRSAVDAHGFPTQSYLQYAKLVPGAGVIRGTVTDGIGNPLKDVVVSADQAGHSAISTIDGTYVLIARPGVHQLSAERAGYDGFTASAVPVLAGEVVELSFTLTAKLPHTIQNASFEHGDLSSWTPWGQVDGAQSDPWHFGIAPMHETYLLGTVVNCGEKDGGAYQSLAAQPGRGLQLSAWVLTWKQGDRPIGGRIGIDPRGGTNPESGAIIWSPWTETDGAWQPMSISAHAQLEQVTIFLQHDQHLANAWNIVAFDAVQLGATAAEVR